MVEGVEEVREPEAVHADADLGSRASACLSALGVHRVDHDVLLREVVVDGADDPADRGRGGVGALAVGVPLAVLAVAADVDVAEARVVAVAAERRASGRPRRSGTGLFQSGIVVPGSGQPGRGRVAPAVGAPGHHPEAELAAAGAGVGQAASNQLQS